MAMTDDERDRFVAETALRTGVNVDALAGMPAESFTQILKNAQQLEHDARHPQMPTLV